MKPAITPQHATAHPHTNQHLWKVRRSYAVATVHCGVVIYTSGQIEKLFNRFISNELISHWSLSHLPLSTCYCVQLLLPAVPSLPFSLLVDWTILDSNNKLKKKNPGTTRFLFLTSVSCHCVMKSQQSITNTTSQSPRSDWRKQPE